MLGLLQRATSNLKNPVTATAWAPSDELAAGFHRFSQVHSLPLSSLATFAFAATGYYAKGTILFLRRGQGDGTESTQYPPAYDDDNLKPRVEGEVHVAVEARTNSEGLYADSRLEPVQGHERCGISLTTPASSSVGRIGASLSYHITVTFPAEFDSLDTISVDATSFRVLFDPSLSSIQFSILDISTTDASIFFDQLRAKSVQFKNQNRLDPNKSSLKNFQDLISGTIAAADRIEIACENGPVSGTYRATGPIIVNNSNFSIKGDFQGGALRLSTTNAEISGTFEAKRDIMIQNAHGKIEGTYKAPLGCSIKGTYMPITASFEVGQDLRLITTVFRIDATIRILAPPSPVASSSGAAPVARVESAATEGEDELPTFADAMASSSTTLGGAVTVVAETSDAGAELVYEQVPQEVALRSLVRSTGGSVIRVKHGETYEGSFTATCPITHTASVSMPSAPTSRGTRSIRCDIEKRNHIGGIVGYEVSTHEGLSRTVIESGGGAEFVFA
ncbi:Proteophosphoglycan ppg4 [Rhodotorula sp. JG-1b]|nr:Proteophosphoglycan ppg4 [Rhodotorula sp. JG-1b]